MTTRFAFQQAAHINASPAVGISLRQQINPLAAAFPHLAQNDASLHQDPFTATTDAALQSLAEARAFLSAVSEKFVGKINFSEISAYEPWNSRLESEKRKSVLLTYLKSILQSPEATLNEARASLSPPSASMVKAGHTSSFSTASNSTPLRNLNSASLQTGGSIPLVPCIGGLAIPTGAIASSVAALRNSVSATNPTTTLSNLRTLLSTVKQLLLQNWHLGAAAAAVLVALYAAYMYISDSIAMQTAVVTSATGVTLKEQLVAHKEEVEDLAKMLASEKVEEMMAQVELLKNEISVLKSAPVAAAAATSNSVNGNVGSAMMFDEAWKLEREAMMAQLAKLEEENLKLTQALEKIEPTDQVVVNMESDKVADLQERNALLISQLEELTQIRSDQEATIQMLLVKTQKRDLEVEQLMVQNEEQKLVIQKLTDDVGVMRADKLGQEERLKKMEDDILGMRQAFMAMSVRTHSLAGSANEQIESSASPAILQMNDDVQSEVGSVDDWDRVSGISA